MKMRKVKIDGVVVSVPREVVNIDEDFMDFVSYDDYNALERLCERGEDAADDDMKKVSYINMMPEESNKEDGSPLQFGPRVGPYYDSCSDEWNRHSYTSEVHKNK